MFEVPVASLQTAGLVGVRAECAFLVPGTLPEQAVGQDDPACFDAIAVNVAGTARPEILVRRS